MNYNVSVDLLKLAGAQVITNPSNPMQKGVFIPVEQADIAVTANAAYLNMIAWENHAPTKWGTHMVKQSLSKARRAAMSPEQLRTMPILGNISPMRTAVGTQPSASPFSPYRQPD